MTEPLAVPAFWLFVSSPGIALAFALWNVIQLPSFQENRGTIYLTVLALVDFATLLVLAANQSLLGEAYSPGRYSVLVLGLSFSFVLAVLAGRIRNRARNSLFFSASLLTAMWALNLAFSSVV